MSLTRRVFLGWSALVAGVLGITRRIPGQPSPSPRTPELPGLDARALLPLAAAVLPAELGAARVERAAIAFAKWIAGYHEGEETLHPYGSERLGKTGPSPAAKWTAQLASLDASARTTRHAAFRDLPVAQRAELVRQALATEQYAARVPAPVAAPHVALAVLAHFLGSPDATNLAYHRVIDEKQCRPLSSSPNEPVPLRVSASRGEKTI